MAVDQGPRTEQTPKSSTRLAIAQIVILFGVAGAIVRGAIFIGAMIVSPGLLHGQDIAGLEIDRAFFIVATKGPEGKWTARETDRVPLRPQDACYGWRLHFSWNSPSELAWRDEFTLPAIPGKDPTLLVTRRREKPQNGWIGNTWCVTRGDPAGEHVIKVFVQDSLARAFTFFVVSQEGVAGRDPAAAAAGHDAQVVDPLSQLGDFTAQRASLEDELEANYPKPPKRLDTDPTTSAVLLLDIDLTGTFGNSEVNGAAVVADSSGPIRAAPLDGDVVMFHNLPPGSYSLRFIRVDVYKAGDLRPRKTVALHTPPSVEIRVTVAQGGVHYLGSVVVKGKANILGDKPPEYQLTYDAKRETAAWSAFRKKYAATPWAALADGRILALRSPSR